MTRSASNALPAALTCARAVCAVLVLFAARSHPEANLVLDAGGTVLEVDRGSGVLTRLHDDASGITLAAPAGLAESFRLALLKPDNTTVAVLGKDQALSTGRVDGRTMTLGWDGPLKDAAGGDHAISVRMTITAVDRGFTFGLHADNRSAVLAKVRNTPKCKFAELHPGACGEHPTHCCARSGVELVQELRCIPNLREYTSP